MADRLISTVTVTDPRHRLSGQCLAVLSLACVRGPRFIAIALPDGRRRLDDTAERVSTVQRAKLAYIYIRQSTAVQVRQHQESTHLKYRLVDRAAALGWPRERITIVDDDLGKSGTSSAERHGFQRLTAEIGLGGAGLVLSLDTSRLARSNHNWHQLPGLCPFLAY